MMNPVPEGWWPRKTWSSLRNTVSLVYLPELFIGIECLSNTPPAESSVRDLDDDILRVLDFRDRTLFNVNLVRALEDDGAHGIFRGHGGYYSLQLCPEWYLFPISRVVLVDFNSRLST